MVTKEQLKTATRFEHITKKNADGTPLRCRANGQLKTWKTREEDFKLPVKYGMYEYFYITPDNAHDWVLEGEFIPASKAFEILDLVGKTIQVQEPTQRFSCDCYKVKSAAAEYVELEISNGDASDGKIIFVDFNFFAKWKVAVIGEELGLIGGIVLLALFFFLVSRALRVAQLSRNYYGLLIGVGVVSMWIFQVLVNIGMTIGIMTLI